MSTQVIKSVQQLEVVINQCIEKLKTKNSSEKILLCAGGGCIASGALKVKDALENALKDAKLNSKYTIIQTGCLGPCAGGPVLVIEKDKTFYQKITPQDCTEIVTQHLLNGRVVNRLTWLDSSGEKPVPVMTDIEFFHRQTKIVLRNCGNIDPMSIEAYFSVNGYKSLAKVISSMKPEEVIEEMKKSGLRGRGGAGFPTWMKWNFTRQSKGDSKYILCNGDEGDPGAFMDRSVLEGDPHSLIEGMAIGAFAIGARQGYVYVRAEYPLAVERLQKAIDIARAYGLLGENILGSGFSFNLEIRMGSGAFVCGEETALIHSIEGKRGEPRPRPPFPAQSGLWGKPTVLNNVETFANVPAIIEKGGTWFAQFGTEKSKGTKVFALAGAITNSGLVEVPVGTPLGELIYDIGGGIPKGKKFKAAQIGGPSGGCIPRSALNVPLDYESLQELGAIMGSGGLIVMDEDTCMVDVARFFLEFVQDESCGKCVPCRVGTKRMLEILERICQGNGEEGDVEKLIELGTQIKDTAMCGLGQTAPNPVLSTIRHFRKEYDDHIRMKHCEAGVCPSLVRAPCQSGCPAHVDVPGFVSLVSEKRYAEALRLHRERNPFAAVCARVCFHTCEDKCRRSTIDTSVSVRGIKRFMVDQEITIQLPEIKENVENLKRKIAIIGAGPAGLSCAYFLARMGYKPVVFESASRPGGMLVQTIPAYRLPRETLAREIRMIERMGVEILTEKKLGRDFSLAGLKDDGYEAVFIGIGNPDGIKPVIPGSDAEGVDEAVEFLREYNLRGSVKCGSKVIVVGGGNAAIDAARTARRLGAEVTVVYRRTKDQMPAYAEEIDEAMQEGVIIKTLVNPVEIMVKDNKVTGVRCVEMKLGEFDDSGRRRAEKSNDSFVIEADQIIFAIGQTVDCKSLFTEIPLDTIDGYRLKVNDVTGQTSVPWIFAGGDLATGPSSVIEAISGGERAAVGIDHMFTGGDHSFWRGVRKIDTSYDPDADPVPYKREKLPLLAVERRQNNFDEVEMPWVEAEAVRQSKRCLRCDYGKC
jgi:NADH-quinone oxidoreductase subunit F